MDARYIDTTSELAHRWDTSGTCTLEPGPHYEGTNATPRKAAKSKCQAHIPHIAGHKPAMIPFGALCTLRGLTTRQLHQRRNSTLASPSALNNRTSDRIHEHKHAGNDRKKQRAASDLAHQLYLHHPVSGKGCWIDLSFITNSHCKVLSE